MRPFVLFIIICTSTFLTAQIPKATKFTERIHSVQNFDSYSSPFDNLEFENIGPTVFSGRVTDVEVDPNDPNHFYVAYASGGLWETVNNGTTFKPIFDNEEVITIGDIAVNWASNEIWVGTGEVNSSRSSYAGLGIYKSSDNGASWTHQGLSESHHIGRIILDQNDSQTAWVAVLGHLYSDNKERGVFFTNDGGNTWQQTLKIDDKTGVVDLVRDPTYQDVFYAASWQRKRSAWDFSEAGSGSGIYKSVDGGLKWEKMSGPGSGFPDGDGTGRIGLSISSSNEGSVLYALLDNYNRREGEEDDSDEGLVKNDFKTMSKAELLNYSEEDIAVYLKNNRFPKKYTAKKVIKMIQEDKLQPTDLATYLESANALLFDTPVIGAELYRSTDNGQSWSKTHDEFIDGLYYSYGYYFGVVSANPQNSEEVFIAGVPILRSDDGGKSFKSVNGANVHSDHHSIWINPENPKHIINGNDGGINISYDSGESWIKCNSPSVGQFYYINVDNAKTYNVYGGTQDNGVWKGSHKYRKGVRWHNTGQYPYKSVMGGDGMQVQIDPRDNNTIYTGFQFGNYFRVNINSRQRKRITPSHELGSSPYRWNWQAPIHLSIHQPDIFYMGAERLFRSFDKGDSFKAISNDLTQGGKKGDVPYGTLASIHESPLRFGLIYTGSDDGLIHVTKDGGYRWSNITQGLPKNLWVSRVQASAHNEATVYTSLNGYRFDDFKAYLYKSDDYGATWQKIGADLPSEPINVVKEDPINANIIYVGTDRGVYISVDKGQSFLRCGKEIPNVPVHDIVIQKEAKDLLIGTHGRSIYRGDLEPLYEWTKNEDALLFIMPLASVNYNKNLGSKRNSYSEYTKDEQMIIVYADSPGDYQMEVHKSDSVSVYSMSILLKEGFNYVKYDLSINDDKIGAYEDSFEEEVTCKKSKDGKSYLLPGNYNISFTKGSTTANQSIEIKEKK